MYMCICIYIYVYIYIHIHIHTHVYQHVCISVYVYIYIYAHIWPCSDPLQRRSALLHVSNHVHMCLCIFMCVHTFVIFVSVSARVCVCVCACVWNARCLFASLSPSSRYCVSWYCSSCSLSLSLSLSPPLAVFLSRRVIWFLEGASARVRDGASWSRQMSVTIMSPLAAAQRNENIPCPLFVSSFFPNYLSHRIGAIRRQMNLQIPNITIMDSEKQTTLQGLLRTSGMKCTRTKSNGSLIEGPSTNALKSATSASVKQN